MALGNLGTSQYIISKSRLQCKRASLAVLDAVRDFEKTVHSAAGASIRTVRSYHRGKTVSGRMNKVKKKKRKSFL